MAKLLKNQLVNTSQTLLKGDVVLTVSTGFLLDILEG